jgi:predicted dehydrogenase
MINVAVVGFGFMGLTHTINLLKNKNANLVAIVVRNPDNIRKKLQKQPGNFSTGTIREEQLSKIKIYSSFDACINNEKLDACIIAVHTHLHFEFTIKALQAGINVFLEKPASLVVNEITQMIVLAQTNKLLLMVGQVVRFMPPYLKLKKWIESGEYGSLQWLTLSRVSGLPAWGNWKEKQQDFGSSGGALFDLVIHDIDFAQWVLGQPDEIVATCLPGKLSHHDYVNAIWKYKATGLHVKIDGGNVFHSAFPFQASFTASFENASVSYSSNNPENIIVATDNETTLVPAGDANEGFSGELDYFINCLMNKTLPQQCSPESAMASIKLCYKHIQSN